MPNEQIIRWEMLQYGCCSLEEVCRGFINSLNTNQMNAAISSSAI